MAASVFYPSPIRSSCNFTWLLCLLFILKRIGFRQLFKCLEVLCQLIREFLNKFCKLFVRFAKKCTIVQGKIYPDRKSTRLNSSHVAISYAVFCLKKKY